jgi:hypothetical protein
VVVLQELSDAGDRDENADVEQSLELRADSNELAARRAEKGPRRDVREDALIAQAKDGRFDFGVDE